MGQKLRGLVAQSMIGRKGNLPVSPVPQMLDTFAGSGVFISLYTGILSIYVFGSGGAGDGASGGGGAGGGGGAAFKRIRVTPGQMLPWSVGIGAAGVSGAGSDGGPTTVTLPNGNILLATGGLGSSSRNGASGGVGSGGDASGTGGTGGNANSTGAAGSNGGDLGGIADSPTSGGGGCGGLASVTSGLGFPAAPGLAVPTGRGGFGNSIGGVGGAGGNGRVLMLLQVYAARP